MWWSSFLFNDYMVLFPKRESGRGVKLTTNSNLVSVLLTAHLYHHSHTHLHIMHWDNCTFTVSPVSATSV